MMNANGKVTIACLLVSAVSVRAAIQIPPAKCLEAEVVRTLTAPAKTAMHMPTDVAVDRAGRVFVADGTNDRIVVFSPDGRFKRTIAEPGGKKLSDPIGLTVDKADRLWIADTGNHRLIVVTAAGQLVELIDLPKSEQGRPADPTDVAVTLDGRRAYIVDNDNHRLIVLDNQSKQFSIAGRFGRALGQFQWPFMIGVAPKGHLYVSETIGARVQRIRPPRRWAGQIGRWGVELGQFYRPKGVALDATGRLYVSDSTLGLVQVFEPRGEVVGVLTNSQGEPLRFQHPMGMCFDTAGRLYVVELGADRIAVVSFRNGSASPVSQPADSAARED